MWNFNFPKQRSRLLTRQSSFIFKALLIAFVFLTSDLGFGAQASHIWGDLFSTCPSFKGWGIYLLSCVYTGDHRKQNVLNTNLSLNYTVGLRKRQP